MFNHNEVFREVLCKKFPFFTILVEENTEILEDFE
jgi:hypothetical protein